MKLTPMNGISAFRSPISCKKNKKLGCKALIPSVMIFFATWLVLALPFYSSAWAARELVFIPLPLENQETTLSAHTPLIRYLEQEMGVSIRIHYEKEYEQILRLFKAGKADLVQLGPLPFATLRKETDSIRPLVIINESDGKPYYTCSLVTSFDGPPSVSAISSPLALPQKLSTCATFAASLFFKNYQRDIERLGYSLQGNHEQAALAVIRGECATGIVKTQIAKKYRNLSLTILEETPPLPGFMIAGNKATMSEQQLAQLEQFLLQTTPETRASWVVGKDGFSEFSSQDFALFFDADR